MNNYLVDFNDVPWESPAPGIRVKAVVRGGKKLRLVEFTHEFVEPDWCTKAHIGLVLEGELALDIDGIVHKFRAGDGLFIAGGERNRHRHHATPETTRLFLVEEA
jgi:quercetin dioxygenase-like cupin family protein